MSEQTVANLLATYLRAKLAGSSLQIKHDANNQITVFAGDDISIKVEIDSSKRNLEFSLFSPKLNRVVAFEQINDAAFLDARLDDELKSIDHEAEEADISLAIDLLEVWANENGYSFTHKA